MGLDEDLRQKIVRLAETLLSGTKSGKVAWTPTDRDDKFLCTGTRSSVTMESFNDRDGDSIYRLELLNDHGTVVDSLQTEYANSGGSAWTAEDWNGVLHDLFYAARRVAYNVDDAIDSMLADIEDGISAPRAQANKKVGDPWATDDPWSKTEYSDEPPF